MVRCLQYVLTGQPEVPPTAAGSCQCIHVTNLAIPVKLEGREAGDGELRLSAWFHRVRGSKRSGRRARCKSSLAMCGHQSELHGAFLSISLFPVAVVTSKNSVGSDINFLGRPKTIWSRE